MILSAIERNAFWGSPASNQGFLKGAQCGAGVRKPSGGPIHPNNVP